MTVYRVYSASDPMDAEKQNRLLSLMNSAFPDTERRTDKGQRMLFSHPLYRVHTLEEDGKILAFMAAWALPGLTFFEHFAVDPSLRNQGVGGRFLDELLSRAEKPAVLEVELPEEELSRRRVGFYRRHGMHLNERDYAQLPLRPGDSSTPMFLMSWPDMLSDEEFVRIRKEIYRHVYTAGVT